MINAELSAPAPARTRWRPRRYSVAVAAVVALGLVAPACGTSSSGSKGTSSTSTAPATKVPEVNPAGDIPDNQAYVVYAPAGEGYSVKVPEGWARVAKGGATVFTDKLNSIQIERSSEPNAPSVATVTAVAIPKLARSGKNFKPGKVSVVHRSAGNAVLATYQVDGPPDAVTTKITRLAVERYQFWNNGHSLVLTLSGAKGADNVDPWKMVTNSFGWKP